MSRILGVHAGKILAQWNKTATNDMRHSMNSFGEKASRMKPEITAVSCGPTHLQETIRTQVRSRTTVINTIAWHSAVLCYSTGATVDYELLYNKEREDHQETKKNLYKEIGKIGTLEAQLVSSKKNLYKEIGKIGTLEAQLRASEVYVLLLGTLKRVDNLEKMLAPPGIILSGPRKNRWEKIFAQKDNKLVEVFRSEMKKIGLQENDLSVALSIICQDANERSAHFNIPLPDTVDDSSIESTLKIMGIRPDAPLKKAYKLINQPLKEVPDYFDD